MGAPGLKHRRNGFRDVQTDQCPGPLTFWSLVSATTLPQEGCEVSPWSRPPEGLLDGLGRLLVEAKAGLVGWSSSSLGRRGLGDQVMARPAMMGPTP